VYTLQNISITLIAAVASVDDDVNAFKMHPHSFSQFLHLPPIFCHFYISLLGTKKFCCSFYHL
jgi:hypothetical protein